ncbi:MAG: hypothetical protein Tsb0020_23770 [Haliangiales bacterium]
MIPPNAMAVDTREFARTLTYARQAGPAEVLEDLQTLREIDAHSESKVALWGTVKTACVVAAIAAVALGLMVHVASGLGAAIGFAVGALVAQQRRRVHARLDIENRRYEMTQNVVRLLAADMAPDAGLAVHIDFGAADALHKRSDSETVGEWDVERFRDPWLSLAGRFVDGTRYRVRFSHELQKRSRWKRSASGKRKYKSKRKSKNVAAIELRPKASKYPHLPSLARALDETVQLPEYAELAHAELDGDRITLKALVRDGWREDGLRASHVIAMMLLSGYQVLNAAKAIGRRGHAA